MSPRLAATMALYGVGLGAFAGYEAVRGRGLTAPLVGGLLLLEIAAIVQATLDVAGLLGGHRPADRSTHVGYVAASVLLLPVVLASASPDRRAGGWEATIAAVGCLGLAIVALRLKLTWAG